MTYRTRYVLVSFVPSLVNISEDIAATRLRVERQLAELERMADVGLGLCREVAAKAKGAERLTYDPSLAFCRISRAVRLTIVLENRIADAYQQILAGGPKVLDQITKAKAVVLDVLHTSIANELENNPDCDRELLAEMRQSLPKTISERIDREDLYEAAPIADVIEIISEALDIPIDWSLWQESEWLSEDWQSKADPPNTDHPAEVDPDTEPVGA